MADGAVSDVTTCLAEESRPDAFQSDSDIDKMEASAGAAHESENISPQDFLRETDASCIQHASSAEFPAEGPVTETISADHPPTAAPVPQTGGSVSLALAGKVTVETATQIEGPGDDEKPANSFDALCAGVLQMMAVNTNQKGGGGSVLFHEEFPKVRDLVANFPHDNIKVMANTILDTMDQHKRLNTNTSWRCYLVLLLRHVGYEEHKLEELISFRKIGQEAIEQAEALVYMELNKDTSANEVPKRGKRDSGQVGHKDEPAGKRTAVESRSIQDPRSVVVEKLKREGRIDSALEIRGRDASKKNSSINGIYALLPESYDDAPAYELISRDALPRFLRYFSKKKCWKIRDVVDDTGSGSFAFVKARVENGLKPLLPSDLGPRSVWQVFDGKAEGHNEDPKVRCSKLRESLNNGSGLQAKAKLHTGSSGSESETQPATHVHKAHVKRRLNSVRVCTCLVLQDGEEII